MALARTTLALRLATVALGVLTASCVDDRRAGTVPTAPSAAALSRAGADAKPMVVLVHGAWADGAAWGPVITRLEGDGYRVVAVQNALRSVAGDVTTAKRVIDAQRGPVVVVAHSYGGVVITGAAAGNPNVKALVYIAAYAPDAGEAFGALANRLGPTAINTALVPDAAGRLYIDLAKFRDVFAPDVMREQARVMAVTQTPLASTVFGESVPQAAWRTIPSWYLVSQEDRVINPDLERFMAGRMGAHTSEVRSSHVSLVSHPGAVAEVIEAAARARTP